MLSTLHSTVIGAASGALLGLSARGRALREMEGSQWHTPAELRVLQERKLTALLTSAYQHVPFFRQQLDQIGYRPGDRARVQDLPTLPVLTKRTIQTHSSQMRNPHIPGKVNHTGGSTGAPLTFYQDAQYWRANGADKLRTYAMCGYRLGDPALFLWGSDYDARRHRGIRGLLQDRLMMNIRWINAFALDPSSLSQYLHQMQALEPRLVVGYASALFYLARRVLETGWRSRTAPPRGVQSSAESLTAPMRDAIQEAFQAPVFDRYGCREVGNIAHECQAHRGLHVLEENNLVEVVDSTGNPVGLGQLGRIVVTNLNNYAMPFIRYDTGDVGALSPSRCPCGRGLALIERLAGRSSDLIATPSGRVVHGEFFTHLFYKVNGVREFQVVQETLEEMVVRIVPDEGYSSATETFLRKVIREQCDPSFQIRFEYPQSLPPSPSGKRRFTLSNVPIFQPATDTQEARAP